MKKLLLFLSIITYILTINYSYSYSVTKVSKNEIDKINCDLNFNGNLEQGYSYNFSDSFSNLKNSDIKIEEIKIYNYEGYNYNNSSNDLDFNFTNWIKNKNNILKKGESGVVIKSTNRYTIVKVGIPKNDNNFIIKYKAKFYTKDSNGNFTQGPYYHTECKYYKISGCGDGILDTNAGEKCDYNDQKKQNWGSNGCSQTCQKLEKTEPKQLNPSCNHITVSKTSGTEKLDSNISCSGNDISKLEIDCGNGQKFTKTFDQIQSSANFSKICNYNKFGNYTATCRINDSSKTCKKNITVNKKQLNPSCNHITVSKTSGTEKLDSNISCSGNDISKLEIDCGNGQKFTKTFDQIQSSANFSKICNYNKFGNYTATCRINDSSKTCKKNIIVKQKPIVKENLTEYEINIKKIILKYRKYKIKYNKILKEEQEKGIGLITPPKILPKTGTPIEKRTKIFKNPKVDTELKKERFRLAGNYNPDLNFWKQALPNKDKNANKYLVIPSSGLVIPINEIPSENIDYSQLISGREIKVNKYLKSGSMEYAGTSINGYGKVGNKVVFGHSSYFKKDNGRYKTDFGKIIELDPDEEIWIYVKNNNGIYKRFRYKTIASYNTKPTDVSVLQPGIGKNLTLFTCTPVGGIAGRWIIKAKFIDEEKNKLEEKLNFNNINPKIKIKVNKFINKLSKIEKKKKQERILKIFKFLIIKEKKIKKKKLIDFIDYLKYKLAIEYYR